MGNSDNSDNDSIVNSDGNVEYEETFDESYKQQSSSAVLTLFKVFDLSSESKGKKLVSMRRGNIIFMSGFCRVTLLKGSLEINGHSLVYGKPTTVKNPSWLPCCRVVASAAGPSNRDFDKLILSHCDGTSEVYKMSMSALKDDSDYCCVYLFEELSFHEQEWMIAVEDQSYYSHDSVMKRLCIGRSKSEQDLISRSSHVMECSLCTVGTGMIGSADHMKSLKLELMSYPESWTAAVQTVCAAMDHSSTTESEPIQVPSTIKAVICGAKGVGKSSCLRYAVNSVLSQCRSFVDAVCVIDCDIGQPEFTVPGLISLQIVTNPILEANHYNMHRSVGLSSSSGDSTGGDWIKNIRDGIRMGRNQVVCSYYLGDLTTKNDPELLIACLRRLLDQYQALSEQYDVAEAESANKQLKKSSSSSALYRGSGNNFSVLMDDDDDRSRSKKRKASSASAASQPRKMIPLFVNTDGFIRYMGEEVLFNVLSSVRPTHVFQFSSRNDARLASVERYKALLREEVIKQQPTLSNDANSVDDGTELDISGAVTVCVLAAGRESPSKRHATDLRDLRVVSYFLGGSSGSAGGVAEDPLGLKSRIRGAPTNPLAEHSSGSSSGDANNSASGLYMSSNILVDLEGTLAVALLRLTTLIIPFDRVAVQSIGGVSVGKFLAALNGSMVGIVQLPKADSSSAGESVPIVSHKLRMAIAHGSSGGASDGAVTLHTIPALPGAKLLPCLGVAVVKCVDVVKQYFAITAPVTTVKRIVDTTASSPGTSQGDSRSRLFGQAVAPVISIAIIKGEASQQLPNALLYAPGMPCYPYLSSESAGEGSSKMRARNNVKRRSQQQK